MLKTKKPYVIAILLNLLFFSVADSMEKASLDLDGSGKMVEVKLPYKY